MKPGIKPSIFFSMVTKIRKCEVGLLVMLLFFWEDMYPFMINDVPVFSED